MRSAIKMLTFLKENVTPESAERDPESVIRLFREEYHQLKGIVPSSLRMETAAVKAKGETPASPKTLRSVSVFELSSSASEVFFPEFMPEPNLPALERAIKRAYDSGIRRFRVPALYGLELLKPYSDIEITLSAPLPVANSQAVLMAEQLGATRALAHIELDKESLISMRSKSCLELELYRFGRPALLVTRAALPVEGECRDARNISFQVRYDSNNRLYRLYPDKIHSVPRLPGFHDFYDLTVANWNPEQTDSFNFDRELS